MVDVFMDWESLERFFNFFFAPIERQSLSDRHKKGYKPTTAPVLPGAGLCCVLVEVARGQVPQQDAGTVCRCSPPPWGSTAFHRPLEGRLHGRQNHRRSGLDGSGPSILQMVTNGEREASRQEGYLRSHGRSGTQAAGLTSLALCSGVHCATRVGPRWLASSTRFLG